MSKKLAIIATKGTLDWAYPPYILASTAAALGYEVQVFFTFYGLQLVRKDLSALKVSPLGNPGMPMKMPFGPKWFRAINWNIPNIIQANVPGFESLATVLMQQTIKNNGDYSYTVYKLGATYDLGDGWAAGAYAKNTNAKEAFYTVNGKDLSKARLVAFVSKSF